MAVDDPLWQTLAPLQRRQRILDALKRLLLRESQAQPLLLVVENLHWSEAETQAFLDGLVESLPAARLLLLATYRPEYRHGRGPKTYYTQLRLDPLPPAGADEILQALLGAEVGARRAVPLQPLMRLLIERTQGNPFFLEESVQSPVETQVLAGEPGAYRLAKTPLRIQVPATVQAVLTARIDRLPPEEKRLLQTAAVIGREVPFALLQTIAERPDEALATVAQSAARWWEAELYRLRGELPLQRPVGHPGEAEACFQRALDIARRQQAKSLELRAAMSLSRLWLRQGRRGAAGELLAPIYGWFTEGFDTADLQEAKALLEELA